MRETNIYRLLVVASIVVVGSVGWPAAGDAQTVTGQARAVKATVLGLTTVLSDTGTLGGLNDAREASLLTGAVTSVLTGQALHATTVSAPDRTESEASIAALNVTVAGIGVSAGFVMAQASAVLGSAAAGSTLIDGLSVNGVPITVTGALNQTISFLLGRVVINEQQITPNGVTVNALRVVVNGVADVVIASATAGI